MLFAIDYDHTYHADEPAWNEAIAVFRRHGHDFICVTGRNPETEALQREMDMPVLYSPGKYKRQTAEEAGYEVDVWIDDNPGIIQPGAFG
jgi:hypothetical protein